MTISKKGAAILLWILRVHAPEKLARMKLSAVGMKFSKLIR